MAMNFEKSINLAEVLMTEIQLFVNERLSENTLEEDVLEEINYAIEFVGVHSEDVF